MQIPIFIYEFYLGKLLFDYNIPSKMKIGWLNMCSYLILRIVSDLEKMPRGILLLSVKYIRLAKCTTLRRARGYNLIDTFLGQ